MSIWLLGAPWLLWVRVQCQPGTAGSCSVEALLSMVWQT